MIKNIFKVLISNGVLMLLGLLNGFLFPILLSIEDFAYYQEYILYISYVNICHLGIASGMFLNYAGHEYKETDKAQYKSEIFLIYLVLGIFTLLGFILFYFFNSAMILCVVLTIFPQGLIASFQALYQAWERFTSYSVLNALPKLLFTVLIILSFFATWNVSGNYVVTAYLIIQWLAALYFMLEFRLFTKGSGCNNLFSKKNMEIGFHGFLITLGNYVNLIFHSIDKQFVHILFNTLSFAQYSFAMSTQNVMTIFITALANPFYPRLAKGDLDKNYISRLKRILFIFGAYSGCAYFGVSFCVKHFIIKYQDSLKVVAMFFTVFPAMAVIQVLYINLYKIRRIFKKYIFTLIGMTVLACVFNGLSVLVYGDYVSIAFATMILYYVWLFYSQKDFDDIKIDKIDLLYLSGFYGIYFGLIQIKNDLVGFFTYGVVITIWNCCIYKDTVSYLLNVFGKKIRNGRRT